MEGLSLDAQKVSEIPRGAVDSAIAPRWNYKITDNLYFSPGYFHAIAIVLLLFLLVLTFARLRRMYVHWSLKGSVGMITVGFVLALVLEGLLILSGKTILSGLFGWESAPKPISTVLDSGRQQLAKSIGEGEVLEASTAATSAESVVANYQSLSPQEQEKAAGLICSER